MKKIFYLIGFILFILLSISVCSATQSETDTIETFALNHETEECCVFEGNIYTEIPFGWEEYSLDYEDFFYEVNTSFGSCRFDKALDYTTVNWKKCCEQLGFEFVENKNFDKEFFKILKNDFYCKEYLEHDESELAIDSVNAKCTLLCCRMGNIGNFKKYNNGLEIYSAQQQYPTAIIKTTVGECRFNPHKPQDCCEQLGYTYISKNFDKGKITSLDYRRFLFSPIGLIVIILFLTILFFMIIKYFIKKTK